MNLPMLRSMYIYITSTTTTATNEVSYAAATSGADSTSSDVNHGAATGVSIAPFTRGGPGSGLESGLGTT